MLIQCLILAQKWGEKQGQKEGGRELEGINQTWKSATRILWRLLWYSLQVNTWKSPYMPTNRPKKKNLKWTVKNSFKQNMRFEVSVLWGYDSMHKNSLLGGSKYEFYCRLTSPTKHHQHREDTKLFTKVKKRIQHKEGKQYSNNKGMCQNTPIEIEY